MSASGVQAGRITSSVDEPQTETDHIMPLKRQRNRRTLHFSDGTEDVSDSESSDVVDAAIEPKVEETNLTLGQRMRRRMKRVGTGILAGIDYVGGEVASLLGMGEPVEATKLRKKSRKSSAESDERKPWNSGDLKNNNSTEPLTVQPRASNNNQLHTVITTHTVASNTTHINESLTEHASASNNQQFHEHLNEPNMTFSNKELTTVSVIQNR